jgi:hypothetical protein
MLPASYATGTAVLLAVGGLLACFAGFRLFRFVLGLYGFLFGAFIATSVMGTASTWALVVAAVAGGVVGALLMVAAYFMGVGLVGAGLAAFAMNVIWRFIGGDPPTWLLVIVCVVGALAALSVVRWVVITGTAIAVSAWADGRPDLADRPVVRPDGGWRRRADDDNGQGRQAQARQGRIS